MKIGVIRYPGTNCFYDAINYFGKDNCIEIWYKNDKMPNIDLLIIPGGFAFGDDIIKMLLIIDLLIHQVKWL